MLYVEQSFYGVETSESRSGVPRKFTFWCWERMEIRCTDRVRNEILEEKRKKEIAYI